MLTVTVRRDINIENQRIKAGTEVARIITRLQVGTLASLLAQPYLHDVVDEPSEIDPRDPFELDLAACAESLSADEGAELIAHLIARPDVAALVSSGEVDPDATDDESQNTTPTDANPTVPPTPTDVTDDTRLETLFPESAIGTDVAGILAELNVETFGELKEYLAIDGNTLTTPNGIGPKSAERMIQICPPLATSV
ncbi:hypothetical protein [Roseiconus lacunae]|uniref:Helix-hairpin-helix domain-containing protein n=1 Tax=Roseiconus lacunae TaxID=2605694 RepID=A0ABT7PHS5_9BACT|nr:hypothetical protein [Roseiconus lacunae]MDM4015844.1 hypothetical protein [Roseiconus lacunae]